MLIIYINYNLLYITEYFTSSPGFEKIPVEFSYSLANIL